MSDPNLDAQLAEAFGGVDSAHVPGVGTYFEPGEGLVELVSAELKKGHKGLTFIVEARHLTHVPGRRLPEVEGGPDPGPTPESMAAPGMEATWVVPKKWDNFAAHCKGFGLAVFQKLAQDQGKAPETVTAAQVTQASLAKIVKSPHLVRGMVLYRKSVQTRTKSGGLFTATVWRCPTPEELKAAETPSAPSVAAPAPSPQPTPAAPAVDALEDLLGAGSTVPAPTPPPAPSPPPAPTAAPTLDQKVAKILETWPGTYTDAQVRASGDAWIDQAYSAALA
jgi:hypothetical protein